MPFYKRFYNAFLHAFLHAFLQGLPDDDTMSNNVNKFKHKVKKTFLTSLSEKDQDIYVCYG